VIEWCVADLGLGIFELKMSDPEGKNLLTEKSMRDMMDSLDGLAQSPDIKVLLITGGPETFSGGASLEKLKRLAAGEEDLALWELPGRIVGFPVPVIAAMEGNAVGGGLMLALCCDMTVAAEERRYGLNFTALGFTPGMGATRIVPLLVGHGKGMEIILTGKNYRGRELAGTGLFNSVVPAADVRETALDLARRIADVPRRVIELMKHSLSEDRAAALESAARRELEMHRECFDDPETARRIDESYSP